MLAKASSLLKWSCRNLKKSKILIVDSFSPGLTLTLYINQFDYKVPEGLISGMLNKGIEMTGFWSGFKQHFYKKKSLFIRLEKLFNTRQYKNFYFCFWTYISK